MDSDSQEIENTLAGIHKITESALQAISQKQNYDAFILLLDRSKRIAFMANRINEIPFPIAELESIRNETENLQQRLVESMTEYEQAISSIIESARAFRAYGTSLDMTSKRRPYGP